MIPQPSAESIRARRWTSAIVGGAVPVMLQLHRQWPIDDARPAMVWTLLGTIALLAAWRRSALHALVTLAIFTAIVVPWNAVYQPYLVVGFVTSMSLLAGLAFGAIGRRPGPAAEPSPSILLGLFWAVASLHLVFQRGFERPGQVLAVGGVVVVTVVAFPQAWARLDAAILAPATRVAGPFRPIAHLVERAFHVFARALSAVFLTVLFGLTVLVPSALQIITRRDPTWAPRATASRWVRRDGGHDLQAQALWVADPAPRAAIRQRSQRAVMSVSAVALAALLVFAVDAGSVLSWVRRPVGKGPSPSPLDIVAPDQTAAGDMAAQPWFPSLNKHINEASTDAVLSQYVGLENNDVASRWVNIEDGVRTSWLPPERACAPTRTVWMFGGSTTFGVGQRDEHTLSSALAKAAWEDGIRLEIDNYGVNGDTAWQQQRRLERAMILREEQPDLVVFYDGFNDVRAVEWRYMAGFDVEDNFWSANDQSLMPLLNSLEQEIRDGETRLVVDPIDINERLADEEIVLKGADLQLTAAHEMVTEDLEAKDVGFIHYLQPVRATRAVDVKADFGTSDLARERWQRFRRMVPPDVVDLTESLDDDRVPHYVDDVHTNEEANPKIAAQMWDQMKVRMGDRLGLEDSTCS